MKIVTAFAVGLVLAGALSAAPVYAQNARSFVSANGNDGNNCGLAAPCRTFAGALLVTNSGGEIDVLDPAGYGAMNITKAVSIVNDGVGTAGVVVPSGSIGISISVNPSDAVSLRGLSIEGGGTGQTGVQFNTGGSLTIENCVIRHVTVDGIDFYSAGAGNLAVSNSLVSDNGGNGISVVSTGAGTVTAVFNRVEANNNTVHGIYVAGANGTGTINATVSESLAAHNTSAGFYAYTEPGHSPTNLTVFHSVSANNGYGLLVQHAGATLRVAQSVVTGNTSGGWYIDGVLASYGDNYIDGNAANTGSLTPATKQ